VMPFYGAVSAAKAALESHVRQLALELGPAGVAVNAIRAGVTDTPASRKIPAAEYLFQEARRRNPGGRLTCPEDVAGAIAALVLPGTRLRRARLAAGPTRRVRPPPRFSGETPRTKR